MNTVVAWNAGGTPVPRPALITPDERHGWRQRATAAGTIYAAGDGAAESAVEALLRGGDLPSAATLSAALKLVRGCWAVLVTGPRGVIAAVDHIRSLPLFYAEGRAGAVIGDDARAVAAAAELNAVDQFAARELALAGYVTGGRTVYSGLAQLRPGDVSVWRPDGGCDRDQHHAYAPPDDEHAPPVTPDELAVAIDASIDRLITATHGRPIWVPLSGGLDSRLILAKLAERAYRPLVAFSYGPSGNSEAAVARAVAHRLGVSWRFVATSARQIRAFFASRERREYWRFADGLASIPNMQDIHPLAVLRREGALPGEAVIVNGQTGDFITGGHIPSSVVAKSAVERTTLFDAIIDKHFALWRPLLTSACRQLLHQHLSSYLSIDPDGAPLSRAAAAAIFERFECAERQAKFVVNGQRAYEWHGLGWHLPLWDRDIVELFARAPLVDRIGQALYRRYLAGWDFRGVFSDFPRHVTTWPAVAAAVITPMAVAARLALGRSVRDQVFRYFDYWGRFGTQYMAFGFVAYARHRHALRNPVSLYARTWLLEQGIDPDRLK